MKCIYSNTSVTNILESIDTRNIISYIKLSYRGETSISNVRSESPIVTHH